MREKTEIIVKLLNYFEDVPWWSLCTFYLLACEVGVTVGDSGLCCDELRENN